MHPGEVTRWQDTHEPTSQPAAHTKQPWIVSDQTNVHDFGLLEEIRKKKITQTQGEHADLAQKDPNQTQNLLANLC